LRPARVVPAEVTSAHSGLDRIQLSPRTPLPPDPPEAQPPPVAPKQPPPRRIPWVAMATSALGGVIMATVFRTAFMLVFSILAPAGMLLQFLWEKRRTRSSYAEELTAHEELVAAHSREVAARAAQKLRQTR